EPCTHYHPLTSCPGNPWRSFQRVVALLSIEYRERVYGSLGFNMVSKLPQFELVLKTTHCVAANLFTNKGHLKPTASQRAWLSAVIQVFHRIKGLAMAGTKTRQKDLKIFNYLLPPDGICFLSEDQEQIITSVLSKNACPYYLYAQDASLIFKKLNTNCSLETKKAILHFAIQLNLPAFALQWKEKSDIDFTEELLKEFLARTIFYQEVELLQKIFDKESTEREEKALKEMLTTHFPMEGAKKAIIYKAVCKKYQHLSIILLTYINLAQTALNELLKIASSLGLDLVVKHLLTNPAIGEKERGEALYIATRDQQDTVIKILISHSISVSFLGAAVCCAAEKNNINIVNLLWKLGPISLYHQNQMLYYAASHDNLDIITLRLNSTNHPLTLHQQIIALGYAKNKEKIKKFLITPNDPLICFPNYIPSSLGMPYDFRKITTEELMKKSPEPEPILEDPIICNLRYWTIPPKF
ncbi:MAG: ankyrin repeat domain-containing protein, partial [Chlamydiales bacterium]|nr:ankyrin repeat domain-containing protein [Chlamydiales bacterium]